MCQLLVLLPIAPSPLPLFLSIILTFFPSLSLPLSSSANPSCLAGSVFSGVCSTVPSFSFSSLIRLFSVSFLLSLFALIYSHFQLCDNFLYRLVMEALREIHKKKVIKVLQGHTKATLVTFCSATSPQGFRTSFRLLSRHQPFPSVQENQEVKPAAVKPGSPGREVTRGSQRGIQCPC